MDIEVGDVLEFCHATLLDVWMDSGRHSSALTEFVFGQIDQCTLSDDKRSEINKKIRSFEIFVTSNLQKCSRNMRTFREKHSQWLLKSLKIHLENHSEMENLKKGRPKLTYDEGGSRLKRKLAGEVALKNENDTQLLIYAASISARKSSEHSVAFLLANCNRSEAQATEAKRKLHTAEPIPLTINEALEFFIDNSLSKQLYKEIRQISKLHNCDIYPNYKKVLEAKLQLRPHRSMDSSDPLISSMGIKKRTARHKKQPLPQDVIELLEAPHHIVQSNTKSFVNNESFNDLLDDSDDSESNEINPFSFELAVENY
ncbi:uncharacterized protein LOC116656346 isoform X2 [Drosophila ananassae]|uniref:uncharacterized protein LOC116656346 isoform X2 n=1 Tax=Drosophila ananassae TaxID=7217 RepID=UPI0013A5CDF2|nr:uncharacterized protein LOC116656346 isoform X2 [Drosophila ananassae]